EGHPPLRDRARGGAQRNQRRRRAPAAGHDAGAAVSAALSPTDPRRFRRLAYLTAALTFALIVVGGIVRISDSGLGCGAAGRCREACPLCGGRAVPVIDTNMIIEYTHRILAAGVTILIAYLVWTAWRHRR